MSKPTLYVALDGPILTESAAKADPFLRTGIADYAKPFLHWAAHRFNVRLVTDRSPRDAFYLIDKLSLPASALPVSAFEVSKTECIRPNENFYWVDGALIPQEVSWLAEHGKTQRFLPVDGGTGVTPKHKEVLEQALRGKK